MASNISRINSLRLLAGILATSLSIPALAQSVQFPTYPVGPQADGSWVVSDGQIITPTGIQVALGNNVRAKAVAVNPTGNHTAAVLTLGAPEAVEVFNTVTGAVLQGYIPFGVDPSGSYSGITYSADGKHLYFSQASSNVMIANVNAAGYLSDGVHVKVPANTSFINCFPNSPMGAFGQSCGQFFSGGTSYPGGIGLSPDGTSAYALLNQNNTLAKIDLTQTPAALGTQIRVGNAPHSILISADGNTAYVSNEGGRIATQNDFQILSTGTPIVADSIVGAAVTGSVSVVDLPSLTVTANIATGLHPTGLAFWGKYLLVANAYSDNIQAIDTTTNTVAWKIGVGVPVTIGQKTFFGAGPNSIAVDSVNNIAYVALYNANAIAVVNLASGVKTPVLGYIPTAYAPSSVVLDTVDNVLLVANDKGVGARYSYEKDFGVTGYNTHQDNGTVSIIAVPNPAALSTMTTQVWRNNHWDLTENVASASGGSPSTPPTAIPAHVGDPSLIKHVFLIIRENRTYDQVLGDVAAGNGSPALAVFGANVTPNVHSLVQRFPLLDNFYNPSRQSADGHNWVLQAMAPYADDIESPWWERSYPSQGGDAMAYQPKGFLFSQAEAKRLSVKIYGEYAENATYAKNVSWRQYYNDALSYEAGNETNLQYFTNVKMTSSIPAVKGVLNTYFPWFDLNIPEQFRFDIWKHYFDADVAAGKVPALTILTFGVDHTGGPSTAVAAQADNDLAVGRLIEAITKSNVWNSSAIFIEEDDAQNGVDHVDGHRSPGYVVSPYVIQTGITDHTHYNQVNVTRTIEQILGLTPMNQFDLVASPMTTLFIDNPPADNFLPWTHVANLVPLDQGVAASVINKADTPAIKTLRAAWAAKKTQLFRGKTTKPDSVDSEILNHMIWYETTGYTRPYPGENKVLAPSDFKTATSVPVDND